jgi:hypothetical protein
MPNVSKIVYKGKDIVLVDYRGCLDEDEMIATFRKAEKVISGYPQGILILINFEGAYQTPNYMKEAKKITKQTQKYVIKRAIVGLDSPTRLIILNTFNRLLEEKSIRPFKSMKAAKDWLVS